MNVQGAPLLRSAPRAESLPIDVAEDAHDITWRELAHWIMAAIIAIPAAPLLVLGILLVRLSSRGPAIYRQTRVGREGREFVLYKLRTMIQNSEQGTGPVWCQQNDRRITPIGRFLRTTHLDELPQLFNVLRGDMLLVGPRPERPEIIEKLLPDVPGYLRRLNVHQGITGMAQVYLPADLTVDDVRRKIIFDRYYAHHRSLLLDLKLMVATVLAGLPFSWVRRALALPTHRQIEAWRPTLQQAPVEDDAAELVPALAD